MPNDAITAEVPRNQTGKEEDLRSLVLKYQVHNCRPVRCFRNAQGKATEQCKYGFPFKVRESDGYGDSGQTYEYRRRKQEDTTIVPYNMYLLLAWKGHVNVQKITKTGLERYLVKYISKLEPTFNLQIEHSSEVRRYLESRIVGAPEAAAIQLSYHMVASNMAVVFINTELPENRRRRLKSLKDLKATDPESEDVFMTGPLEHYMRRPRVPSFENVTYPQYMCRYQLLSSMKQVPQRHKNAPKDEDNITVIQRNKELIPRYRFLTPLDGESFYFQQLLLHVPFRCINTLVTEENESKTYKEECYIRGLFDLEDDLTLTFQEMKKRNFDPSQIAKVARKMLIEEIADAKTLQRKLHKTDFGEPIPFDDHELMSLCEVGVEVENEPPNEEVMGMLKTNMAQLLVEKESLAERLQKLTQDQLSVVQHCSNHSDSQITLFVTGPGGTGKSYLLHTLKLSLEHSGLNVEILATSGSAAQLVGGCTVHSFFKLDPDLQAHYNYEDQTWRTIRATDVLIVDEVSMMSGELLEKVDSICRDVASQSDKDALFGRKHIILFGDLFQLPAVVKPPVVRQIFQSWLWVHFVPFFLSTSCRQSKDEGFATLLNRVREGEQTHDDIVVLQSRVCGTGHHLDAECTYNMDPGSIVICSKHADREKLNSLLQERLLGDQPVHYLQARDYDSSGLHLTARETQYVDSIKGIMPNQIKVRNKAKVMITRNLDVEQGVVNGSVGTLEKVSDKVLFVKKFDSGNVVPVPRVKQKVIIRQTGQVAYRTQFPIMLAWACTAHRVQGMTLKKVFIHLDETFFASGQAYVALSRVRSLSDVHLLSFNSASIKTSLPVQEVMSFARTSGKLRLPSKAVCEEHSAEEYSTKKNIVAVGAENEVENLAEKAVASHEAITSKLQVLKATAQKVSLSFPAAMFQKGLSLPLFCERISQYGPTMVVLSKLIAEVSPPLFQATQHQIDKIAYSMMHSQFLEHYTPVQTSADGNCLWHMVSLAVCGSETLTFVLRVATLYALHVNRNHFQAMIAKDPEVFDKHNQPVAKRILSRYKSILRDTRLWKNWGNEYHLLALSFALQRDIYVYSQFDKQDPDLKLSFDAKDSKNGRQRNHLVYSVPLDLRSSQYNQHGVICGFFSPARSHYTAVLRKTDQAVQFMPYTDLFEHRCVSRETAVPKANLVSKLSTNRLKRTTVIDVTLEQQAGMQYSKQVCTRANFESGVTLECVNTKQLQAVKEPLKINSLVDMSRNVLQEIPVALFRKEEYCLRAVHAQLELLGDSLHRIVQSVAEIKPPFFDDVQHQVDNTTYSMMHSQFLEHYTPVQTSADGNCLWHMVSLAVCGSETLTFVLRVATLYVLHANRNHFRAMIAKDPEVFDEKDHPKARSVTRKYRSLLRDARLWNTWGNEYHLLALSFALQRDIYVYSQFDKQDPDLKLSFDSKDSKNGRQRNHLVYSVPSDLRSSQYNQHSAICGFFSPARSHYTAVLKITDSSVVFTPCSNLFTN